MKPLETVAGCFMLAAFIVSNLILWGAIAHTFQNENLESVLLCLSGDTSLDRKVA